jgi:DNA modification methylase
MEYLLLEGDTLEMLREMDSDSVDSIVTDPPYGLKFMGKKWDYTIPSVAVWQEAFRVLKPGGHVLCACGTRTQHRMTVNIEDGGFEIRDVITWHYGCLSDDTEVLTEKGFLTIVDILKDRDLRIGIYDKNKDEYRWEVPNKWSIYNITDTAYRIKSDFTDQLVSRNHRCLVERKGEMVFQFAESLKETENVPYLEDLSSMQSSLFDYAFPSKKKRLLFQCMQWVCKRSGMENVCKSWFNYFKSTRKHIKKGKQGGEKRGMEGWNNLQEQKGLLQRSENKVCEVSGGILQHVKEGRLCNGVQVDNGSANRQSINQDRVCTSYRSQSNEQHYNQSDAIQEQQRPQEIRSRKSYNTTLATISPVEYSGIIFCPTVSTGVFVARRNGKIFITGNSGFPKSLDVSKAIDKQAGAEREVIGKKTGGAYSTQTKNLGINRINENCEDGRKTPQTRGADFGLITSASTEAAKEWQGWGTALKPATEFWTLARKPLEEDTVAENVIKYKTGAIHIDACRIETDDNLNGGGYAKIGNKSALPGDEMDAVGKTVGKDFVQPEGRFPANVIFDEFTAELLDEQSGYSETKRCDKPSKAENGNTWGGTIQTNRGPRGHTDSGGASRFFYVAKASRKERNAGLENLDFEKVVGHNRFDKCQECGGTILQNPSRPSACSCDEPVRGDNKIKGNFHPTVKPITLMRYLVKLITPPGGTCLDMYNGSGTTGCACAIEDFIYIGIDNEPDYIAISTARIEHWKKVTEDEQRKGQEKKAS